MLQVRVLAVVLLTAATAAAQGVNRQYAESPTNGMALPLAPMTGEHDARTVSVNPGGLALIRGTELALALDVEDPDTATDDGQGFGAFAASSVGGTLLPKVAVGLGFEWLRPPRSTLLPDPGQPFRFTLAMATGLGKNAGFGVAWHHFAADGLLDGADTFDLGLSARLCNYFALGAALRDVATGAIGTPMGTTTPYSVERRYEAELLLRPLGTDALELAVGGRLGETSADLDGWARIDARVARGVLVHAGVETRDTRAFVSSATDPTPQEIDGRDVRAMLGLELSFGRYGITAIGQGLRNDRHDNHVLGGQVVIRLSTQGPPSVVGDPDRLERVELTGTIEPRELTTIVARLRGMARDPHVKGVIVTFDGASGGWGTLEELRNEILAVRAAKKKVFAYMVSGTGRDYFVATAADRIYVDPAGGIRIVGMAATQLYFRGVFDWLGVTPQFDKIAEYKSAPEQFTNTESSEPARRMENDLFDSLWERYIAAIADSRHLTQDEVKALIDAGPYTAGDLAKDHKLVDEVAAPDKVGQLIATEMGEILPVTGVLPDRPERWQRPQIAVIYIDGDIVDGKSRSVPLLGQSMVGSESLVNAITAARANPDIGAIVLRIDSPGGSALASELISREVFATRGVKPILCSLGDVAASGGYFIAAGCDTIFSDPMTITGSIGIFYGKFDVGALAKKLGVNIEVYQRGKRADVESYFRSYTDEERGMLLEKLRYMYSRFVGAVAEGRKMTKESVDAVGRGHVYTGAQAQPLHLVDKFGGFADTLDEAKRRMKLDPGTRVQLIELPTPPTSIFGALGRYVGLHADAKNASPFADLPILQQLLRGVPPAMLAEPTAPMARLPLDLIGD
ncbi:MAG TPA: signal peptide peptidase SppA [Kofleriaceae bacterium]|jgi:protease-4